MKRYFLAILLIVGVLLNLYQGCINYFSRVLLDIKFLSKINFRKLSTFSISTNSRTFRNCCCVKENLLKYLLKNYFAVSFMPTYISLLNFRRK